MSDKNIEKVFLYFIALSLLLHAAVLTGLYLLPEKKEGKKPEPYMVELTDAPEVKEKSKQKTQTKRLDEFRRRVAREVAPRGDWYRDQRPSRPPSEPRKPPTIENPRVDTVPKSDTRPRVVSPDMKKLPELAKLFPSAERMSKLEESYRNKYAAEIEEGDTLFLNSNETKLASFLSRFDSALHDVWIYPKEAVEAGIQGDTPFMITYNRRGVIEKIQLLQTSGSRILDDESLRALRAMMPLGNLPRSYEKDHLNLIVFLQYRIIGGSGRGSIR